MSRAFQASSNKPFQGYVTFPASFNNPRPRVLGLPGLSGRWLFFTKARLRHYPPNRARLQHYHICIPTKLSSLSPAACSGVPSGCSFSPKPSSGTSPWLKQLRRPAEWLRNTTQGPIGPTPPCRFYPNQFCFFPISTLGLAVTTYNGTSKVHYGQFRRTGRQLS